MQRGDRFLIVAAPATGVNVERWVARAFLFPDLPGCGGRKELPAAREVLADRSQ